MLTKLDMFNFDVKRQRAFLRGQSICSSWLRTRVVTFQNDGNFKNETHSLICDVNWLMVH